MVTLQEITFNVNPINFTLVEIEMQTLTAQAGISAVYDLALDERPAVVYCAGLSKSSQRVQWSALCLAAVVLTAGACDPSTLPWWELRRQHVNALRAWLADNRSVATANRVLTAVKCTLKECWRLDRMTVEAYHRAVDVKAVAGSGEAAAAGRQITDGEKVALLAGCRADPSPKGVRDGVVLGLAMYAGLRRDEIAGLALADYDPGGGPLGAASSGTGSGGGVVHVVGKGRKRRAVPLTAGLAAALGEWLALRQAQCGSWDGALLCRVRKGGEILPYGISGAAVYDVFAERAAAVGVRSCTPHDGRRSFVGDLLDAGVDTVTVQRLAGHSDPKTTAGYDRRPERVKVEAVGRLHMRWEVRGSEEGKRGVRE